METELKNYNVKTNRGIIVITGTDENDARTMAEKAGFVTFSAEEIQKEQKAQSTDYIGWCASMGIEPC